MRLEQIARYIENQRPSRKRRDVLLYLLDNRDFTGRDRPGRVSAEASTRARLVLANRLTCRGCCIGPSSGS